MLSNVQQKINCIFETSVRHFDSNCLQSGKRPKQTFVVEATDILRNEFLQRLEAGECLATEKLDGTSAMIKHFGDQPWLWARHDRKLYKNVTKNKSNLKHNDIESKNQEPINLNSFKEAPPNWKASENCIDKDTGDIILDANGHIMGWVPVDPSSRQHCWHAETFDLSSGLAVFLKPQRIYNSNEQFKSEEEGDSLLISTEPLESYLDSTVELIGTSVNNNPYKLGTKRLPLHFLVRHGVFNVDNIPANLDHDSLRDWFQNNFNGRVEGIVWHCSDGSMFKLHRHHLKLTWPVDRPKLSTLPVLVKVDPICKESSLKNFRRLASVNGRRFANINELSDALENKSDT